MYSTEMLQAIYHRTSGYCHLCGQKINLSNYAQPGARGAWEVEHSKPKAKGGTDHGNNLYPACISCNRSKGTSSSHSVRAANGITGAPLSREQRTIAKRDNGVAWGIVGAVVGSIFGPVGTAAGSVIGAAVGYDMNPDK